MMFTRKQGLVTTALIMVAVGGMTLAILDSYPQTTHVDGLLDPWSIQDVSDNSQYVVKGRVVDLNTSIDKNSREFGDKPIVYTDAVIEIEKELTGKYLEDTITVRTVGGKTDKYWTSTAIYPEFKQGEDVILFVGYEPDSIMGDNYFVAGYNLGKYMVQDGKAYGDEYKDGLSEKQFLTKIRQIVK